MMIIKISSINFILLKVIFHAPFCFFTLVMHEVIYTFFSDQMTKPSANFLTYHSNEFGTFSLFTITITIITMRFSFDDISMYFSKAKAEKIRPV